MTEFEKQFPELKDVEQFHNYDFDFEMIGIENIEKYCFSKQRVREAMKIVFDKTRGLPAVGVAFELLLKELSGEKE